MMNETSGRSISCCRHRVQLHFFPMHLLGTAGFPRRLADPYNYPYLEHLLPMNQFITYSAILMGAAQVLLIGNFLYSIFKGPRWGVIRGTQRTRMDGSFASRAREFDILRWSTAALRIRLAPVDEDFLRRRGISRTKTGTPIRM